MWDELLNYNSVLCLKMLKIFIKANLVTWNYSCSFPKYYLIYKMHFADQG